jgi:hypothetical protein
LENVTETVRSGWLQRQPKELYSCVHKTGLHVLLDGAEVSLGRGRIIGKYEIQQAITQ